MDEAPIVHRPTEEEFWGVAYGSRADDEVEGDVVDEEDLGQWSDDSENERTRAREREKARE